MEKLHTVLFDTSSGEEIDDIVFHCDAKPSAGEKINYWTDEGENYHSILRTFTVVSVEHNWQFLSSKNGGTELYVQSLILHVQEVKAPKLKARRKARVRRNSG